VFEKKKTETKTHASQMVCKNDRLIMTVPEPGLFFVHVMQRFLRVTSIWSWRGYCCSYSNEVLETPRKQYPSGSIIHL